MLPLKNIKTYTAWGSSCITVGLGVSTETFALSVTPAATYEYVGDFMSSVSNLYSTVFDTAKNIEQP